LTDTRKTEISFRRVSAFA